MTCGCVECCCICCPFNHCNCCKCRKEVIEDYSSDDEEYDRYCNNENKCDATGTCNTDCNLYDRINCCIQQSFYELGCTGLLPYIGPTGCATYVPHTCNCSTVCLGQYCTCYCHNGGYTGATGWIPYNCNCSLFCAGGNCNCYCHNAPVTVEAGNYYLITEGGRMIKVTDYFNCTGNTGDTGSTGCTGYLSCIDYISCAPFDYTGGCTGFYYDSICTGDSGSTGCCVNTLYCNCLRKIKYFRKTINKLIEHPSFKCCCMGLLFSQLLHILICYEEMDQIDLINQGISLQEAYKCEDNNRLREVLMSIKSTLSNIHRNHKICDDKHRCCHKKRKHCKKMHTHCIYPRSKIQLDVLKILIWSCFDIEYCRYCNIDNCNICKA